MCAGLAPHCYDMVTQPQTMMKKFKRRLSLTLKGGRGATELSELAEHLTVEDTVSEIKENGTSESTV